MSLNIPAGFLWAAGTAGLKASGKPDLAIALAPETATAAAMFTTNRVVAAPLSLGRDHLKRSRNTVAALVVNSGNANCATGAHGAKAAKAICASVAKLAGVPVHQVFPSSTGIIGVPLPYEKIVRAAPVVIAQADATEESARAFSHAILTTDTRAKLASVRLRVGGSDVAVMGVAKGSGMIHPNMATMLAYIFTDLEASATLLSRMLRSAVRQTFNCISVDGDTSTNDTVLLLASGASGVGLSGAPVSQFQAALNEICLQLAQQIVADGEGVRHVIELKVEGARSESDAHVVARAVANSPLVKTAWAGADPNWGRILAAIGYSGVTLDPRNVNIYIGEHQVCRKGAATTFSAADAHTVMQGSNYRIRIHLGMGKATVRFFACDLSPEYVSINSEYST